MATEHWKELVMGKRRQQAATIPKAWILKNLPTKDTLNVVDFSETCGLLTAKEVGITNSDVCLLLENLATSKWSAVEVTIAFAKRAITAHQLINCLTEIFIERALVRAAQLDGVLKTTGKVVGPLHGLPISLKDQINVKGLDSTIGYVSWINRPAAKNSILEDILEECGAVLYVKTNVPQSLMWLETYNHIFGRTTNPYNRSLTAGGSSGGEGALIALKGSPIGVGSDIGGSVRIPAAFNGLYGLRGSSGRIPVAGCSSPLEGQDSVQGILGPLCNSMGGLKTFMKTVISQKTWLRDPMAASKPWSEAEYELLYHGEGRTKLCFAIMWDDGQVVPHPPVTRGLEETKRALIAAGHHVIDWKPLKHSEICQAVLATLGAAAAEDVRATTKSSGEPIIESLHPGVEDLDANVIGERSALQAQEEGSSAYELWQVQRKRRDLRQEYLDYWNITAASTGTGRPVDAIISPCAPYVAPPHGTNNSIDYTVIWNGLDYTSLTLPTGLAVDPKLDAQRAPHQFYNELDKANYELYNPATFKDAPIGIQLIGRAFEEEAVIAMGEIVDSALKKKFCHAKL